MKINTDKEIIDKLKEGALSGDVARKLFDCRRLYRLLKNGEICFDNKTREFYVRCD